MGNFLPSGFLPSGFLPAFYLPQTLSVVWTLPVEITSGMPDVIAIRLNEQRPITGSLAVAGGTAAITAGSWSLSDEWGASYASGESLTGFETGQLAAPEAWAQINPAELGLTPGQFYWLTFSLDVTGSDGGAQIVEPVVILKVLFDYQ